MNNLNLNEEKNEVLGTLDSLNCFIGLTKSFLKDKKIKKILTDIQNDIFVIQANVADPENVTCLPPNISLDRILALQENTYWFEQNLKKIDHFIIPEGTTATCCLHVVRTMARDVERKLPDYLKKPSVIAQYFDCVACFMFVLARYVNQKQFFFKERAPKYFASQSKIPRRRRP
ncbi:MAG: ATP:cob(I)alamin adenosyltransferase [Parcubacteria group bacterium]|nr:ATP:cob(I)alamin adenosyltransferase [Parcubacteria group bacterium]